MDTIQATDTDFSEVSEILQGYFDGLYHGDIKKLTSIFHSDTRLKAPGVRRSLKQWIIDVSERQSPAQLNQPFAFKILSIDIVQDQAMAKICCPLFEFNYIDFLGLLKEDGEWRIVTKMYTDLQDVT